MRLQLGLLPIQEHGQGLAGGTPWEFRDRYIENSPLFYLDRVTTPTLIIHGSADDAVASFLGDQTFVALRRLGQEVVYAKYERGSHGPAEFAYPDRLDCLQRIVSWFDAHLKTAPAQQTVSDP